MLALNKKEWQKNKEIYVWIFNVGRGFSSFIKTPHNYGMMIDCGTDADFHPFADVIEPNFLRYVDLAEVPNRKAKLVQLIVSHPHSDHCLEIEYILNKYPPLLLTTPHSNEKESDKAMWVNWSLVKNPDSGNAAVECLKKEINKRKPPLRAYISDLGFAVPGFEYRIFYIPPKLNEQHLPKADYVNNLSILTYLRLGENSILFMGDMMPSGCEYLLKTDKEFSGIVRRGISILVVAHHGLESAFYQGLFDIMPKGKVKFVNIISEKRGGEKDEGKTHKKYLSSDLACGYGDKYSFSTKNDGHIRIIIGTGNKLTIDTSREINDLI